MEAEPVKEGTRESRCDYSTEAAASSVCSIAPSFNPLAGKAWTAPNTGKNNKLRTSSRDVQHDEAERASWCMVSTFPNLDCSPFWQDDE